MYLQQSVNKLTLPISSSKKAVSGPIFFPTKNHPHPEMPQPAADRSVAELFEALIRLEEGFDKKKPTKLTQKKREIDKRVDVEIPI